MGPEVRHGETEVYPRVDARLGNSEAAITLTHGCTNPAGVLGRAAIRPGFWPVYYVGRISRALRPTSDALGNEARYRAEGLCRVNVDRGIWRLVGIGHD